MKPKRRLVLLVLADAYRYDYLDRSTHSPFLSGLKQQPGVSVARTEEPFGFVTRPAFFAGMTPEQSDLCTMYWFDPAHSPYRLASLVPRWVERWPFLDRKLRAAFLHYARFVTKGSASRLYHSPLEIPFELLRFFDVTEKHLPWEEGFPGPNLFTDLNIAGKKWRYYGWPLVNDYASDQQIVDQFCREVDGTESFVYLHLSLLDGLGHEVGPDSDDLNVGLRKVDQWIQRAYDHARRLYDDVELIVFGDHGMVPVTAEVNLWAELKNSGLIPGRDYVPFLDSTMARFWFLRDEARDKVRDVLARRSEWGTIIDDAAAERYSIRFPHERYWQLAWMAKPGIVVFPNFFAQQARVKGMHGYLPDTDLNRGILLVASPSGVSVTRPVVQQTELYSLMTRMLSL